MSGYFVYRPVLAWVIALFAILFGGIALVSLPVEIGRASCRERVSCCV